MEPQCPLSIEWWRGHCAAAGEPPTPVHPVSFAIRV